MLIDEIFTSIQGESKDTGLPCIFIRTWGCPIKCVYCDQPQDPKRVVKMSVSEIISSLEDYPNRVCITGGEPMINPKEVLELAFKLTQKGYEVSIETSGCVPIEDVPFRKFRYIMDIKCPSSLVSNKNIFGNISQLRDIDEIVFVIKDKTDYNYMKEVLKTYNIKARVLLSPMFVDDKNVIGQELVEWVLQDKLDVRVQIQLHKVLNVN